MKVWVVVCVIPYEGGETAYVSSTKEGAQAWVEKHKIVKYNSGPYYDIEEWEVDEG